MKMTNYEENNWGNLTIRRYKDKDLTVKYFYNGRELTQYKIQSPISRQNSQYNMILAEISSLDSLLIDYVNNYVVKTLNNEKVNEILMSAISHSIYISYGKYFTQSTGFIKLDPKKIFDGEELIMHDKIMRFRNKAVAHTESDVYNTRELILLVDEEKERNPTIMPYMHIKRDPIEAEDFRDFQKMIHKIVGYTEQQIKKNKERIFEEAFEKFNIVP